MEIIDQIEEDVSDEVLEAAGTEAVGAWTFVCTMGCDVAEPGPVDLHRSVWPGQDQTPPSY
jgi:hypothetical protein